jgi:hypothetical protein
MPGANYLQPYHHKFLNEIVIPGAHDAGIYVQGSKDNVQTQALDIAGQATAGCRFFDLRIATRQVTEGGVARYEQKAYHLDGKLIGKKTIAPSTKVASGIVGYQSMSKGGGWGGDLNSMLQQARAFVEQNPSEFLILKFSKCFNWVAVAEACLNILEGVHYAGQGNINKKKCGELAGKIITAFDDEPECRNALAPVIARYPQYPVFVFIKSLYDKKTNKSKVYDPKYNGIQYFGKFSSTSKVDQNTKSQAKILDAGSTNDVDCLGMMYWTTTGIFGNIRARNDSMWTDKMKGVLKKTWEQGLAQSIKSRLGGEYARARNTLTLGGGVSQRFKAYMPNIVMLDFIDTDKCNTIEALNRVAAIDLALAVQLPHAFDTV